MITELETGGNIRFEDGKQSDKWYNQCTNMLRSRFSQEQMSQYGICDIAINRITKISNRFLRARFEEKIDSLSDPTEQLPSKSYVDQLFLGQNLSNPKEMFKIIEEGFKTKEESINQPSVSLVNCVACAEIPRLNAQTKGSNPKNKDEQ